MQVRILGIRGEQVLDEGRLACIDTTQTQPVRPFLMVQWGAASTIGPTTGYALHVLE